MKLFLILNLFIFQMLAIANTPDLPSLDSIVSAEALSLTRTDHVVGEHLLNVIKLTEKGYVNKEILNKVTTEVEKSKNFSPFVPWLAAIKKMTGLSKAHDLIVACQPYAQKKEILPLEKVLEKIAGNYCRERTLEAIGRDIDTTNNISDEASQFIKDHLRFFLTKKNKKNFAFFIQSQAAKPEILKKISQEVTTFSVQHEVVPSQEVLKDIVINDKITKLIQEKGFNLLKHQNVFYAEFGKLIEASYKSMDKKPGEEKIQEHYQFLKNYLDLNQDHLPVGLCLTRLNDFAKAVFRNGFKDLSRDIFKFIIKKNNKEILEDAIFFHLWTYLFTNEFKEALEIAKKHDLLKDKAKITDVRLKFWLGYSLESTDDAKEAITYYENIVTNHPLSYYAIMSVKKLQILKPDSAVVKYYQSESVKDSPPPAIQIKDLDADYISSLIRLRAWSKIDSQRFIKLELKRIKLHSMPNLLVSHNSERQLAVRSDLHLLNAKFLVEAQNYLSTFKYIYEVLDKKEIVFNKPLLELLYPRPYLEDLTRVLKKDKLDPIIVLSLIRQESVFNPLARSPVGARGLMQLMPMTARRMRRSVRDKHLVNPKINIELGTQYFKNLLKRYDGNLVYVLSAYNAGEARVERWKGTYFDVDETILKNIESIPFLETRNYVKLIFRNIFFYKLLLDQKSELADTSDPNQIFDVKLGFKK